MLLIVASATSHYSPSYAQWSYLGLGGKRVEALRSHNGFLYAATDAGIWQKPIVSTGTTWTSLGLESKHTKTLLILNDSTFMAGVIITGISSDTVSLLKSTDGGRNWHPSQNGFGSGGSSNQVWALEKNNTQSNELFATGRAMVVAKSTDAGASWRKVYGDWTWGAVGTHFINIDPASSNRAWAGGETGFFQPFVLKSTSSGETWEEIFLNVGGDNACYSIALHSTDSNTAYVGMEGRVMKTTNGGAHWFTVFAPPDYPYFFGLALARDSILYAAGLLNTPSPQRLLFYRSLNGGASWDTITQNTLGMRGVLALLLLPGTIADTLFLGTSGEGVFRCLNVISGVHDSPALTVPHSFLLRQNYPNPFNSGTTIEFSVPLSSYVSLKVLNVLGQEVATLVSEELHVGNFKSEWNSSGLASGVYFYRITAGVFSETRKMILMK